MGARCGYSVVGISSTGSHEFAKYIEMGEMSRIQISTWHVACDVWFLSMKNAQKMTQKLFILPKIDDIYNIRDIQINHVGL